MATIIREFNGLGFTADGSRLSMPPGSPAVTQVLTPGGSPVNSSNFNAAVQYVEIEAEERIRFKIGVGATAAAADSGSDLLPAGGFAQRSVQPGERISVLAA